MHNITKKIIVSIVTIAFALTIVPSASAATVEELQAQIAALLVQIQALQAQLGTVQGTGTGTGACAGITFSRTLKLGMSGTDVKCMQTILNQSADTQVSASGAGSPGSETTYFGAKTKAAVIVFQQKYASEVLTPVGLTAGTGLVGAKTTAKLNAMVGTAGTGTTGTGTTGTTVVLPTASGLTVTAAGDNPIAGTIISDGGTNAAGSQALIPFLKLNFSTPAGTSAKVTTIKLKRLGVCSDTDIPSAYLYEGNTKLAEMTSLSSGVLTFVNAAGLFTVSGVKTITVKVDLYKDATAGKTIGVGIAAVTDVVTDASAINGTFPINGNLMTVATVADFGSLLVATTTNSQTVDPGITGFEVMRFTMTASNQKVKISSLKFLQLGSIAKTDINNIGLYVGSTQLGATQAALASDGTVTFDLSGSPYEIGAGVARTFSLKADVIGGSTRTIRFSMQRSSDIVAQDSNYGVYVTPFSAGTWAAGTALWSVLDSSPVTVNPGNLVISKATDSPSGNLALNSTNITLAKFSVKAVGEDVKVSSIAVNVATTVAGSAVKNVKVYIDGLQIGTNQTTLGLGATGTTTISVSFTVPVGQTQVLEIKSDVAATPVNFGAGSTLQGKIGIGASNAQRMTSLGTFNFPSSEQSGNALTVSTAGLSAALNSSVGSIQTVYNVSKALIGSYLLTAGAAEGVNISKISFSDATTTGTGTTSGAHSLGAAFSNLELYYGSTKLGSTLVTNQSDPLGTEYIFYPQSFNLAAGQTVRVDLKADVANSPTWANGETTQLFWVEGTGLVTSNAAVITGYGAKGGQAITLSGAGAISQAIDSSRPNSAIIGMGQTDVTMGIWKLSANSVEDLTVSKVILQSLIGANATSSGLVGNMKLYCGSDQFGVPADGLVYNAAVGDPYVAFSGTCVIPKGGYKLVTLKADVTPYGSGPFGTGGAGYYTNERSYIAFYMSITKPITGIATDQLVARGAGDYATTATTSSSSAERMYAYRSSLSAAITCNSATICSGSQRNRESSDKVASITLTGNYGSAYLRAAASADDDTLSINWATTVSNNAVRQYAWATATAGAYLDGAAAIFWRASSTNSTYGGTFTATTTPFILVKMPATTTLTAYNRLSMWVYRSGTTTNKDVVVFVASAVGGATPTAADYVGINSGGLLNDVATTTITLIGSMWNHIDIPLNSSTSGVIATSTSAYVGLAFPYFATATVADTIIDSIRVYKDSFSIDVSGNTSGIATGTAFYLKNGATQYAVGYLDKVQTVKLIADTEIGVSSPGQAYDLISNTNVLLASSTTAVETLSLSTDLGAQATAGDINWYDGAIDPMTTITWLNGATPISVSLPY